MSESPVDAAKRAAARAALAELPDGGVLGLGSGSTARIFVEELTAAKAPEALAGYRCVATSNATRSLAESLGLVMLSDSGPWTIDVTVDGADEVSDALDLIKGGGGAHTREKIVNHASRRNVIIVDASKLSRRLGERWPVPVEILDFGAAETIRHLAAHGTPKLRAARSDAANLLVDLAAGPIDDPAALDRALRAIPGVVETGLFVGRADVVLVGSGNGVRRLQRGASGSR